MKKIILILSILCFSFSNAQELQKERSNEEEEVTENSEVSFSIIENVPVYSGCENAKDNNAKKKCFGDKINRLISSKFNTELAQENGLTGRIKIQAIFKVGKDGNVIDIKARSIYPVMEQEAIRVISLIPQMKPGLQRGKPVIVPYIIPIQFIISKEEPKPLTKKERKILERAEKN